jgi:hypothetical protein
MLCRTMLDNTSSPRGGELLYHGLYTPNQVRGVLDKDVLTEPRQS